MALGKTDRNWPKGEVAKRMREPLVRNLTEKLLADWDTKEFGESALFKLGCRPKTESEKVHGFRASFKRNLPLIIPFMPLIVARQLYKGDRIGDGWSNTRVIWKKYKDKLPFTISNVG